MKACVISLVLLFFSFSCPHLWCNTTALPPASTVPFSVEHAGIMDAWLKHSLTDSRAVSGRLWMMLQDGNKKRQVTF